MAPNKLEQTLIISPRVTYTVSSTEAAWENTRTDYTGIYDNGSDTYIITDTYAGLITDEQIKLYKKLLKRMANEMCKSGWINYIPFYTPPKLIPYNLRGVRLDGRGWANL